jgi:GT2 family glycosyltransferase
LSGKVVRGRVGAVVLTYDAPASVQRCVAAIRNQTTAPARIVVVDNASPRRVDTTALGDHTEVLRLPENVGPAGGYAAGLHAFLASDAEWAWLIDDDCVPDPGALEAQLAVTRDGIDVVLASMIDSDTATNTNTQGWCGVLIARKVIEQVGVPNADLFWWTEDTEYLQWRIPRAGFVVGRCHDARVIVTRSRSSSDKPPWKYYYEARNQVHYRLHTQQPGAGPAPRHLSRRVRRWRALRAVTRLAGRALARERSRRAEKLSMVARGTLDGLRGRLGKTVEVGDPHRPAGSRS